MVSARTEPTVVVTPDLDAVVAEIDIVAPAEVVFRALTDSAQLMKWFNDTTCPVKFWKLDARKGGAYSYATESTGLVINGVSEFECHGEILEYDPPRLLVYTWIGNWHINKDRPTTVRYELTPIAGGTRVRVTHSGLAQEPAARKDYSGGWVGVMKNLKQFAETEKEHRMMATRAISQDQDSLEFEAQIAAPPERVFQALTDPRQLVQWWGQKGMYHVSHWSADVRVGGQWRSEGQGDSDGKSFHVSGEYLELDPPRLLVYTWIASWSGSLKTVVRWELTASGGGTRVHVCHSGFGMAPEQAKEHYKGWQSVIRWMQAFVEKGTTVETRA